MATKNITRWTRIAAAALVAIGANTAFATCTPQNPSHCTPQELAALQQRQAQAQQQIAAIMARLQQSQGQVSQNDLANISQNWNLVSPEMQNQFRASVSTIANPEARASVQSAIANAVTVTATGGTVGDGAGSSRVETYNINRTSSTNPVQAYLAGLPTLPQATTDAQYICEYRGRSFKVDRKIFFNGTRTEGPVVTGLDAFIWQYATKKGDDGKVLTDEFGDNKKYPYSRVFVPFGSHKLQEGMLFEGDMASRVTATGVWVEVGKVVKYTHLTSAAAFNGSLALALGSESRQGSAAAASGGTISDRVAVEVKDMNMSCALNADELLFVQSKLIPPAITSQAPKALPETTVAVELVKDEKEIRLPLVHAIGAKPAATPWGACGRDPRTGQLIIVNETEYKAGKRCPTEVVDRKVDYILTGPGSKAQPLQVLVPSAPASAAGK